MEEVDMRGADALLPASSPQSQWDLDLCADKPGDIFSDLVQAEEDDGGCFGDIYLPDCRTFDDAIATGVSNGSGCDFPSTPTKLSDGGRYFGDIYPTDCWTSDAAIATGVSNGSGCDIPSTPTKPSSEPSSGCLDPRLLSTDNPIAPAARAPRLEITTKRDKKRVNTK